MLESLFHSLLDWFNRYVGLEWAAYIALVLTIIGLIIGLIGWKTKASKTVIRQSQNNNSGNAFQIGGDININPRSKDK